MADSPWIALRRVTARQHAIHDFMIVRPYVERRALDPHSSPIWREHLARNDRKVHWLRYLERS